MKFKDISYYHSKSILITGGTGYLGFSLAKKLAQVACKINLLTRKGEMPGLLENAAADVKLYKGDIRDKNIWKDILNDIEIVFHFAGQTSSKYANEHPRDDIETNVLPIINFIETTKQLNISPDIIFSGTSTQAGLTEDLPVDETRQDAPITVYDINKLTAEKYLQYYNNQLGNRSVTLRLSNIYGPGPASSKSDRGITNYMIKKALHNEPLMIYGDGNYMRDYMYIDDVVDAFLSAGRNIEVLKGGYYVMGTGVGYTIKEMVTLIAQKVEKKTGKKTTIQSVPFPNDISPIEFRNFTADTKQFHSKTGWKAAVSLEEGIDKTIKYFLSNTTPINTL